MQVKGTCHRNGLSSCFARSTCSDRRTLAPRPRPHCAGRSGCGLAGSRFSSHVCRAYVRRHASDHVSRRANISAPAAPARLGWICPASPPAASGPSTAAERGGAAGGTHAHEHGVSGARWAGTDITGPASHTSCPAAQGACRTVPTLQGPRAASANRGSSCAANRNKKRFFLLTTIPPIQGANFGQRHQPRSDQCSVGLYFFPLGHAPPNLQACQQHGGGPRKKARR